MARPKDKQPWIKFYPSDWSGDRKLHMCSIGARGLWVEMMCVMHEAEPYGHLVTDGKPVTNRQIAALAGISLSECGRYLMELESAGVYSRTDAKTIFSRRMVRDREKAEKDRNNGKAGGNPKLNNEDKSGVNPPINGEDKAQRPDASSKSSESISKTESPLSFSDSRSEEDRPIPIDESYQPSEAAIEYAYSLKMKKADLDSELSKFRNHCVGLRLASYNPDANFKKWCDQWLDYQRKHEKPKGPEAPSLEPVPLSDGDWRSTVTRFKANRSQWSRHAGPEPGMAGCRCPVQVLVDAQIDPATGYDMTPSWFFIDHTTNEASAFMHDAQSRRVRPPAILKFEQDGVERCGFFSQIAIPSGYDEATGERIAPTNEEDAA
jgi:hypothetical protein